MNDKNYVIGYLEGLIEGVKLMNLEESLIYSLEKALVMIKETLKPEDFQSKNCQHLWGPQTTLGSTCIKCGAIMNSFMIGKNHDQARG